ncbi:MAG: DUF4097 family beta strand repeat-containing protein [Acidobacteriota bacterium]|nr:DUF4097 family beta strand repeat-containing protein [Acidobacteriota bacterium]MDW3229680.1 DUF4097 family beta strand repeat-containing protein [Acidobacteriota bacterium]
MRPKEIVLLLLIILIGVSFYYLEDLRVRVEDWDIDFPFEGSSFIFEEQITEQPVPILEIINSHGSVQVEGTDSSEIIIILEKKVWQKNEGQAREIAEEIKLLKTREADRLVITTNQESFKKKRFTTSFRVRLPKETAIQVKNSFGPVRISGVERVNLNNPHGQVDLLEISGPAKVVNSFEKLSLIDIGGECQVETKHSSAILSRIDGAVKIDCSHEDLELFDLKSSLSLNSQHTRIKAARIAGPSEIVSSYELITLNQSGPAVIKSHHCPVEIVELEGDLELKTTYERIRLEKIKGNLKIEGKSSRIELDGLEAEKIQIDNSYEPVKLENFRGQLDLRQKHADIILSPVSLDFPITVTNEYGDTDFYWPKNQIANLEAETKGGEIHWELPFSPDQNFTNSKAMVKVFTGAENRPKIRLITTYGHIRFLNKE